MSGARVESAKPEGEVGPTAVTRLQTISSLPTEHADTVHDCQMDLYGERLATGSSDASVRIFHVSETSQKHLATLNAHTGPVWQVSWAHPSLGSLLASCSYDRRVIVWREEPAKSNVWTRHHDYVDHDYSVNSVAWAPPQLGYVLACGSSDEHVSVLRCAGHGKPWVATKFRAHTLGVNAVSWELHAGAAVASDDGGLAVADATISAPAFRHRLVTGGCDGLVHVWLVQSPSARAGEDLAIELQFTLRGHADWVRDVAWAPNLGANAQAIASGDRSGVLIIWTAGSSAMQAAATDDHSPTDEASEPLESAAPPQPDDASLPSHHPSMPWQKRLLIPPNPDEPIWRLSWSLTGKTLAVSSGDQGVTLWKETIDDQWVRVAEAAAN